MTRSGFVALAGRPNAGKSTLLNRIVGGKVAIVSDKPQTTRRAIRGIATGPDWQLVIVDLPGMQKPRDLLTERMQTQVERELKEADAVLFVLNGEQEIGRGRPVHRQGDRGVGRPGGDRPQQGGPAEARRRSRPRSRQVGELDVPGEIYPASATTGLNVPEIVAELVALMPEGPPMYPAEQRTDLPENVRLAELIREQALLRTREEVPHAVEVEIDELEPKDDGSVVVRALLWTETESQKGILIGARRADGEGDRRRCARPSSRPSSGARFTWTCRCGCGADGAATRRLLDRLGIE